MENMIQKQVDVAIVGAGIAGLTAARELKKAGKSYTILEARERVGGRTLEGELAGQVFDLGGQWVGPQQKRIMKMLGELGLETFPQYTEGFQLLEMGGKVGKYKGVIPRLPIFALLSADRGIKKLNRMAGALDKERPWDFVHARELDEISVEDWILQNIKIKKSRELIRIGVRAINSVEASEMSMLHFLSYIRGAGSFEQLADVEGAAQQDRILGGAFQIARKLAEIVGPENVVLSSPVRRIDQSEGGVRVYSLKAEVEARDVIVAMAPNMTLGIEFTPDPPAEYTALARRMPMGSVIKVLLAYERPFWRDNDFSGMAVSDKGPFGPVFDACLPDDPRGYLVGFLEGAEGRRFALETEEARKAAVIENLVRWFGAGAANPLAYVDKNWSLDPWSGGCYTGIMTPGTMSTYGRFIREPFGRIRWAGTETATEWMGYLDGAVESGERAVREILSVPGD